MATILVIHGRNEGEWYTLSRTKPTVFGRDDSILGEILDPVVSRRHLEVRYEDIGEHFYAIDLESRNGVFVNGDRVEAFQSLADGDIIQMGHTLLLFTDQEFDTDEEAEARIADAQHQHEALCREATRKAEEYAQRHNLTLSH